MNLLAGHHLDCCINDLKSWTGITPPNRQALRAIITDQDFIDEMNKWYKDNGDSVCGLDTIDRDVLFSIIGNHFTGKDWPLNMDDEEKMNEFTSNLITGLEKEGWAIVYYETD